MAYSPLGYSLPDLTIQGFTAPAASWGNPLTVTVDVKNTGSSTLIEPLSLEQGATSTADAPPSTVVVYASPKGRFANRRAVAIGTFTIPGIEQNDVQQFTASFMLPSRPRGFPGAGGQFDVFFQVNPEQSFLESDYTNNISRKSTVRVAQPFPQLEAIDIDLPATIQPGDVISPNIRVANFGPVDTAVQGPVTVALVASVDQNFGPGSATIATYTIDNISGIETVPSKDGSVLPDTINPRNNVVTIVGSPVQLTDRLRSYYIGVVVDPTNTIAQGNRLGRARRNGATLSLVHKVGPPVEGLPPAGVLDFNTDTGGLPFPYRINQGTGSTDNGTTEPPSDIILR